jgi:hypothetical protein
LLWGVSKCFEGDGEQSAQTQFCILESPKFTISNKQESGEDSF